MKSLSSSGSFKPFEALGLFVERNAINLKPEHADLPAGKHCRPPGPAARRETELDEALFKAAMADVTPIGHENRPEKKAVLLNRGGGTHDPDREALLALKRLVECGTGFTVSQTPEYVEGTGCGVHREMAKQLHRGKYAIQAHIDLHGHTVDTAKDAFDRFFGESTREGMRAVMVVHGRGLSSPAEPVLKSRVVEWLSCGPWYKWVLAFTSARIADGGAGATYVLLRNRPLSRSKRKKWKNR